MGRPVINRQLIVECEERAIKEIGGRVTTEFLNRKTNGNNAYLMENMKTRFHVEAYVAYLAGRMNLTSLKVIFFFETQAQQGILFGMITELPTETYLMNLRKMTKLALNDKMVDDVARFVIQYKNKGFKNEVSQRGCH